MKQFMRIALLICTLFILAACPSPDEINELQSCQLECSNKLVSDIDRCDEENPPGTAQNTCIREVISAYRMCIADCEDN